jgi:hypothetical protein
METLKDLHAKAEQSLSDPRDLSFLAESVVRRFNSPDWARTLYKKAAEAPNIKDVKFDVAASVQKALGDPGLAGAIRNS